MTQRILRKPRTVRAILVERFPNCFMPKGAPKKPLATSILKMVADACPDLDYREIRYALRDYMGGRTYLRTMVADADRFDLQGRVCGVVSERAAARAAEDLKALEARYLARKQEKRLRHLERLRRQADATQKEAA